MGKVYIGVTVVDGHKLWGGERWKIDGRRRGGCGPGMPGPYGGERKIVGRPALRPPRRGQDPSLRCGVRRGV